MAAIYENIAVTLEGADETFEALKTEYNRLLSEKIVTAKAGDLTHRVCVQLRSALDRIAYRYWHLKISPHLSEKDRTNAKDQIYFPAGTTQQSMDATLGKWQWRSVRADHQAMYDYLLTKQPFSSSTNKWLTVLFDLSVQGKHIDLVPQKRFEERRITVTSQSGGSVSWGSGVTFGHGVSIHGAPIDPATQRVVPTPGVTEKIETWVSFVIEGHNINAIGFCGEACKETRRIVQETTDKFGLS